MISGGWKKNVSLLWFQKYSICLFYDFDSTMFHEYFTIKWNKFVYLFCLIRLFIKIIFFYKFMKQFCNMFQVSGKNNLFLIIFMLKLEEKNYIFSETIQIFFCLATIAGKKFVQFIIFDKLFYKNLWQIIKQGDKLLNLW